MTPSSPLTKAQLREQLRAEMSRHQHDIALGSQQLRSQIHAQPLWKKSRSLLFFWPIGHEPDLRPLALLALQESKSVSFPRFFEQTGAYRPCLVRDLQADFSAGPFGISEPALSCPECDPNALDLIFVPGLGFTLDGGRLGRGKGYYDRILTGVSAVKCGVGFDWQIVAELPREAHDIRLDCLVTPSGWRQFASGH